jgi:hypothetical protein
VKFIGAIERTPWGEHIELIAPTTGMIPAFDFPIGSPSRQLHRHRWAAGESIRSGTIPYRAMEREPIRGHVVFMDYDCCPRALNAEKLATALGSKVRMVVLSACKSEWHDEVGDSARLWDAAGAITFTHMIA